ncbi:MAG: ABC transporter [Rickettsiales bacterium]|nr:ABC transporter [Rickettsiales bacterium]|tara:strand:- start:358 stop:2178 length:1821 start_codon:yes stop_codon:yes gene_type:complete
MRNFKTTDNSPDKAKKRTFGEFLSFTWPFLRPYRLQLVIASIALIVAATTVLGLGRGLQYLIDKGFSNSNQLLLDESLFYLFIIVAVLALSSFTRYFFVSWIGERVIADIRKDVFRNLLKLAPPFYEENRAGEVVSRITADSTVLQSVVGSSVSLALRNALMMIGALIMLVITSPKLTGLVALVVPIVIVPIVYFGRKVRARSKIAQDKVAHVGGFIDEALHAISTVQANVQEFNMANDFDRSAEAAYGSAKMYILFRAILSAFVIFIVFSAVGVILWIGGHDVIAGRMSAGELSAFIFYSVVVAGAVGVLSEVAGNLNRAAGAAERLIEYKNLKSPIIEKSNALELERPVQGLIEFKNVNFTYPSAHLDGDLQDQTMLTAIKDLNLTIQAGQTVALVGRSGAGKSTLFKLLLRFYDPDTGSIKIDHHDLKDLKLSGFRDVIGMVPQDPFIFSSTVRDNILFANEDASEEDLILALKQAYAYDFVMALPHGLDTRLGDGGSRLSGGQKQRIAIARAIVRNPAILLLDEATSALDSESEEYVQRALQELMQGRTTLMIAHRLSTVKNADRIIVLDKGTIIQEGTHEQLAKRSGLYQELASRQFKRVS